MQLDEGCGVTGEKGKEEELTFFDGVCRLISALAEPSALRGILIFFCLKSFFINLIAEKK